MLSPCLSQTSIKHMQERLHFSPHSSLTVICFSLLKETKEPGLLISLLLKWLVIRFSLCLFERTDESYEYETIFFGSPED